ncbi:MAG TPA: hypothetical protein VN776_10040 [Terracidiphilus sp.]|nr:hypothetical protein [Terracidiphilus sp.]
MYTGTMIENLIATVERAECWAAAKPAEIRRERDIDPPAAYPQRSNSEQLMKVA